MTPISSSSVIEALQWRYATKVFDPSKKIPAETWAVLEESLVLTPSSYGLQPWKFLVITDPVVREALVPHAWRQRQVADASHLVVLAVRNGYAETDVDANLFRMAEVRGGTPDALMGFKNMVMKTLVHGMSQEDLAQWAKCQAYIALGQFMAVAALLGIDTCPMEGFVPAKMDEALGLATRGYTTAVLCPAGYRSEDDRYAYLPKVRFQPEDVIEHV
ncbi:NAD(P)H-dependent oxidoreductase [Verrucomicrobium spinosum]|uniref:NAD(P)H-dependent oxidoreductase n=1 Tax=Verrucomicrobium spinosum TaxID=2736 RepID=UPI0004928F3A|nr:NAD(P)H-dependent oxidoreductase [Verrucomicrobium spinosum]